MRFSHKNTSSDLPPPSRAYESVVQEVARILPVACSQPKILGYQIVSL